MQLCNILIIDDDLEDIELLLEALKECEVDCVNFALNAVDAFSFISSIRKKCNLPKIIITDLNLPGISGDKFISTLKGMSLLKHIPVVVFSTAVPQCKLNSYLEMDAVAFMKKPLNYNEFLDVARELKARIAA